MVLTRTLRQFATAIVLLASLCGASIAHAANCTAKGTWTVRLTPCPMSLILPYLTSNRAIVSVEFIGPKRLPKEMWVTYTSTSHDFNSHIGGTLFQTVADVQVGILSDLGVGLHTGVLTLTFCAQESCKDIYDTVQVPYKFDVITVPSISSISPTSKLVGDPAFTLKVLGKYFKTGYKIRLNNTDLSTKVVSAGELTATLNLRSVTESRVYDVKVMSTTANFNSNTKTLALKYPKPVLTSVSPTSLVTGAAPFTLQVNGSGFVRDSTIMYGTLNLATHFVSSNELTTTLDWSNAIAGTYSFTVVSPGPGGGTSASASLQFINAAPVITSISPTFLVGPVISAGVTINGTGFTHSSVVSFNGTPAETTYLSSAELQTATPDITTPSYLTVVVSTPAPGGGISNSVTFTVGAVAPVLSWVAPTRIYVGSGDQVLTIVGNSFSPDTVFEWNGTPLTINSTLNLGSRTVLQAMVPAADIGSAGTAMVEVLTPAPGGGSTALPVAVQVHPPEIDSLSPSAIAPGSGDSVLEVDGQDFDPSAVVYWDGNALSTTFVSASELQAAVPAADITSAGVAQLTVVNPVAAGGTSVPASFAIDASGSSVQALKQSVNDIEWDHTNFVLYGSVPSSDANYPHSVVTIDPVSAGVVTSSDTTNEPNLLSVSQDGAYLYLTTSQHVERLDIPGFGLDQGFALTSPANALQVSPIFPQIFAYNTVIGPGVGQVALSDFIDSITLEPWDTLTWSADGSHLYAGSLGAAGNNLVAVSFNITTGTTLASTPNLWSGTRIHVDAATNLIYADNSTAVLDPNSDTQVATFPISGVMVPDSSLGCAYFITQTAAQVTAGANDYTLSCYSTTDQTLTRSLVIPALTGTPTKMMRWGNEGLVFMTNGGMIYFVSGQIVTGN